MVEYLAGNRIRGTNAELSSTGFLYHSGINTYTFTGSDESYTVPSGVTSLIVKIWGAGAGGLGVGGGSGGYVSGTVAVSSGDVIKIVVGDGGAHDGNGGGSNYAGAGTVASWATSPLSYGSGYTGIFSTSVSHSNSILIAGGGGSTGSNSSGSGGGGGGTTGRNGEPASGTYSTTRGYGGTQSAGGSGNGSGSALQGGNSSGAGNYSHGGGGSGYYGGGSPFGSNGVAGSVGAGGGSSYTGGTSTNAVTNAVNTQGSNGSGQASVSPPNTTDSNYIAGIGEGAYNKQGGKGLIVIDTGVPTPITVEDGSIFYATDTNKEYVLYNNTWTEV